MPNPHGLVIPLDDFTTFCGYHRFEFLVFDRAGEEGHEAVAQADMNAALEESAEPCCFPLGIERLRFWFRPDDGICGLSDENRV